MRSAALVVQIGSISLAASSPGRVLTRDVGTASELEIVSATEPTRTADADGLVRPCTGAVSMTATYAYIRSTGRNALATARRGAD